jgi:hypothetical protein
VVNTTPLPFYARERPGWLSTRAGLDMCENFSTRRDYILFTSTQFILKSIHQIFTDYNDVKSPFSQPRFRYIVSPSRHPPGSFIYLRHTSPFTPLHSLHPTLTHTPVRHFPPTPTPSQYTRGGSNLTCPQQTTTYIQVDPNPPLQDHQVPSYPDVPNFLTAVPLSIGLCGKSVNSKR